MWQTKEFKNYESMNNWVTANSHKYQIEEIFINNGYSVEYRKLKLIDIH